MECVVQHVPKEIGTVSWPSVSSPAHVGRRGRVDDEASGVLRRIRQTTPGDHSEIASVESEVQRIGATLLAVGATVLVFVRTYLSHPLEVGLQFAIDGFARQA